MTSSDFVYAPQKSRSSDWLGSGALLDVSAVDADRVSELQRGQVSSPSSTLARKGARRPGYAAAASRSSR